MSSKKDGIIIILSSPSGAGKTTLVKKIAQEKDFVISISHTTRTPRSNEINGKDYNFVSKEKFKELIEKDEFLEHAEVFKNYYGSSKKNVLKNLKEGKNVIFDIDWQGTDQIKENKINYKLITFFILPPSKEILLERLLNRDMQEKSIVQERMKQFNKDILHWKKYDYVVINDNLENCYKAIVKFIDKELINEKDKYDKKFIEKHINELLQ